MVGCAEYRAYQEIDQFAKKTADEYIGRVFTDEYVTKQVTYDSVWEEFLDFIIFEFCKKYHMTDDQIWEDDKMTDIAFAKTKYVTYRFVVKLKEITGKDYEYPYNINPLEYEQ